MDAEITIRSSRASFRTPFSVTSFASSKHAGGLQTIQAKTGKNRSKSAAYLRKLVYFSRSFGANAQSNHWFLDWILGNKCYFWWDSLELRQTNQGHGGGAPRKFRFSFKGF